MDFCSTTIFRLLSFITSTQVQLQVLLYWTTLASPLHLRNYTAPSTEAKRHCVMQISFTSTLEPPSLLPVWTTAIITPSTGCKKGNTSAFNRNEHTFINILYRIRARNKDRNTLCYRPTGFQSGYKKRWAKQLNTKIKLKRRMELNPYCENKYRSCIFPETVQ